MKPFGEKNLDLLQNIECGVIQVYREEPALLDADARDAIEALARHYHAEETGRTPPVRNLGERAERVFAAVQQPCEFRMGREDFAVGRLQPGGTVTAGEMVKALREIQKSIGRWTQRNGRRGYLGFVKDYLP